MVLWREMAPKRHFLPMQAFHHHRGFVILIKLMIALIPCPVRPFLPCAPHVRILRFRQGMMATFYLEDRSSLIRHDVSRVTSEAPQCLQGDCQWAEARTSPAAAAPPRWPSLVAREDAAQRRKLFSDFSPKAHHGDESPSEVDLALAGGPRPWASVSGSFRWGSDAGWGRQALRQWGLGASNARSGKFGAHSDGWPLQTIAESAAHPPAWPEWRTSAVTASRAGESGPRSPSLTPSRAAPRPSEPLTPPNLNGDSIRFVLGRSLSLNKSPGTDPGVSRAIVDPLVEIAAGVNG